VTLPRDLQVTGESYFSNSIHKVHHSTLRHDKEERTTIQESYDGPRCYLMASIVMDLARAIRIMDQER
jgi:hypothetical protein